MALISTQKDYEDALLWALTKANRSGLFFEVEDTFNKFVILRQYKKGSFLTRDELIDSAKDALYEWDI